jgi:hypothetical protein
MGQPHGIDTHFEHDVNVFFVMLGTQGVGYLCTFLMAAHTLERQVTAIQEEPLFRIYAAGAYAQGLAHTVHLAAIYPQRYVHIV